MNAKQENRFNMYLVVKAFFVTNLVLLTTLPNFQVLYNAFLEFIDAISNYSGQQSLNNGGVTKTKLAVRLNLLMLAGNISSRLSAFALFTNNKILQSEIHFSKSKLKSGSDAKINGWSEIIYNRADANLAQLEDYGVTADTLEGLRDAIDSFVGFMPRPKVGKDNLKEATYKLGENFKDAEHTLAQIDALVFMLELSNPDIFNGYRQARKILGYGIRSIALWGKVTDDESHNGLKGVTATIMPDGKTDPELAIIRKSAEKGGFQVKSLPEGTYQVKFTKVGYKDLIVTIQVCKSERCKIKVAMSKV